MSMVRDMQKVVDDSDLWKEFCKAYHMAAPYREQVQYRKDMLTLRDVYIFPDQIIYWDLETPFTVLVDAATGFIHEDMKG